jgi:hypothetical protein
VARAGLSGVSAGAACQCQSRCPPGHRDWLPSRTCHWQSRWAATSGSESGASGRHRSSLLRHLDVQVRHAYKLDHRPGAAASRLGVDLRHWHLRHGGRLLRHGQADCAVPVRPLARGIWRLQAWCLPPGPCVPRFNLKFAPRGPGAFASTADRAQTDQKRDGLLGSVRIYMGQPRCGFVFKLQFSSLVLVVENSIDFPELFP